MNQFKVMKRILFVLVMISLPGFMALAQQKVVKDETKVSKTSSVQQKVHNTFSKHKHHNGYKVKHVKKVEKTKS